jgi:hypothetical protein
MSNDPTEIYQEEEGGVFESEGVHYDLNTIFRLTHGFPVHHYQIKSLLWIMNKTSLTADDENRIQKADLKIPILVTSYRYRLLIVDGYHRLIKAQRTLQKTIPGIYVPSVIMKQAVIPNKKN